MQLPPEIQRTEILDWWEVAREKITQTLPERVPALYYHVDQLIDKMPMRDLFRRRKFLEEKIEPLVVDWIEKLYRELTQALDESFRTSMVKVEGARAQGDWDYGEMAAAGAAVLVSAAPVAGIPFLAGGFTTAGVSFFGLATIGGGALMVLPVAALAGSVTLLAAGPTARGAAVARLKSGYRDSVHNAIDVRLFGDPQDQSVTSLKGILLNELRGVAVMRMDAIE